MIHNKKETVQKRHPWESSKEKATADHKKRTQRLVAHNITDNTEVECPAISLDLYAAVMQLCSGTKLTGKSTSEWLNKNKIKVLGWPS